LLGEADMTTRAPLAPSPGIRVLQVREVGAAFLRRRPLIVTPFALLAVTTLAAAGVPRRQLVMVGCAIALAVLAFWAEARRLRRRPLGEAALLRSLAATLAVLGLACAGTGGLGSPLLPLLFAPAVTVFAAFGRTRASAGILVAAVALVAALGALPAGVPFPALPRTAHAVLAAGATVTALLLLRTSVAGLTDAYLRSADRLDRMRQDVVEDAAARLRSLEAIGARVAHEVRNPLAAVKGLVRLLARAVPESDERARKRFDVVEGEIERMETLLNEYLSFSRPLDELRLEATDLGALLDDVASVMEARAAEAGVSLRRDGDRGGPVVVQADGRRLKQAIINLAANALEATPAGGTITLSVRALAAGAEIRVVDDGRGMPPELLGRLGKPFVSGREGGTGLGLVVTRTTVRQHGGELAFNSEAGRGTTVRLQLPPFPGHGR
jgi:signal transduction histidine kinase